MRVTALWVAVCLSPSAVFAQVQPPTPQTRGSLPTISKYYFISGLQPGGVLSDKRVDLDLENASIKDAVKQIVDRARVNMEVAVDTDVPEDVRVTLKARNVKASTALDLVSQAAGVRWGIEVRDDKSSLRLGKTVRPGLPLHLFPGTIKPEDLEGLPLFLESLKDRVPTVSRTAPLPRAPFTIDPKRVPNKTVLSPFLGQRYTFTCPHCKGQATMVRSGDQPKCPKCSRLFQSDWQFCPADGTKRPAAPSGWRFCPLCGKQVEPDKAQP
jgi:hypothetical protein